MESIRINRYLAMCGLGSRRTCEQLVADGRVTVNGEVVKGLGQRVLAKDRVLVDGEPARPEREAVVLLHKPRGVVCTRSDPQERRTVYDLLPPEFQTLAHVGRLDRESEGLLVLTNAGDLSHRLTHPASKVEKEYMVQVDKVFDGRDRQRLLDGIALDDGMAYVVRVEILAPRILRLVLQQGIKRQIRLMLDALGYEVRQLVRTRIGSLEDTKLKPGKWRRLTPRDIEALQVNPSAAKGGKGPAGLPAGMTLPPPPTPKGRRPAVQAAAGSGRRSPDTPVRGVAPKSPAATRNRTLGPKSPGKPAGKSPGRPAGKTGRPAGKSGRPGSKSGTGSAPSRNPRAGKSAAGGKKTSRAAAPKRGSKRPR